MDKVSVRVVFAKRGRAIYISHLDLMQTMQRAIKRAKLPVWYTEGFNPRMYMNFPLPLSLGIISECEPMDIAVIEDITLDEIKSRLNASLPDGMEIMDCFYPRHNIKDIGSAAYEVAFGSDCGADVLSDTLDSFMSQERIIVMKHSKKKGEVEVDIKPNIGLRDRKKEDGKLIVSFTLPAGVDLNLNPSLFCGAFRSYCADKGINAEEVCTKRTNILCRDSAEFA